MRVTNKPTILIAGDRNISDILSKRLPARICNIVNAGTFVAALSEAADSSLVVVDGEMPGYQELCGHLRGDPITAEIPLIFLSHTGKENPGVHLDQTVPFRDPGALERALRKHCPELALSPGAAPAQDVLAPEEALGDVPEAANEFDDRSSTAMFRRPATEPGTALEWPPPPPTRKINQELVEHAKEYAGYFNSLIEALEKPDNLSDAEKVRLAQVSDLTLDDAEALIASVQTAMNEALRDKNLDQMRILSTAKNKLYEKRQRLRALVAEQGLPSVDKPPASKMTGPMARVEVPEDGWDIDSVEGEEPVESGPSSSYTGPVPTGEEEASQPGIGKSALTMAAEARDAERKKTRRMARQSAKKKDPTGTFKRPDISPGRPTKPSYKWVSVPIAGMLVLLATITIIHSMGKRQTGATTTTHPENTAPVMEWVILEQGPAGVVARPAAKDAEEHRISYEIRWFKNNAEIEGEHTARLKPKNYSPGDTVFVEVIPADMYDKGKAMRSRELTIQQDFGKGRPSSP